MQLPELRGGLPLVAVKRVGQEMGNQVRILGPELPDPGLVVRGVVEDVGAFVARSGRPAHCIAELRDVIVVQRVVPRRVADSLQLVEERPIRPKRERAIDQRQDLLVQVARLLFEGLFQELPQDRPSTGTSRQPPVQRIHIVLAR